MSGIWRHAALFDDPPSTRPTLGEGDTPETDLPDLAARWGLTSLRLKREDLNPNGSHKDRGLLYQVAHHHRPGQPSTHVISSSGNAAASAAAACAVTGDQLVAFVARDTDPAKVARIAHRGGVVVKASKPVNFARYAARVFGLVNLRGTADPQSSVGYRSLAGEIDAGVVFTFSSSGTSAKGLLDGFVRSRKRTAVWSVQSGRALGIVKAAGGHVVEDPDSPAGRLGVRNPPGADKLARLLLESGGGAISVDSAGVARGAAWLRDAGVQASPEGGAVLAAIEQIARSRGLRGGIVAVMTGAAHRDTGAADAAEVDSYLEVRAFLQGLGLEPS